MTGQLVTILGELDLDYKPFLITRQNLNQHRIDR